jgi:hypothetical protein
MEFLPVSVKKMPLAAPTHKYEVMQGQAAIVQQKQISGFQHELVVEATTPAAICFYHFYFPGWTVLVDGTRTQIHTENPFGLIMFEVPTGKHSVRIVFGQTPIRMAGLCITWLSIFLLSGFLLFCSHTNKNKCRPGVL